MNNTNTPINVINAYKLGTADSITAQKHQDVYVAIHEIDLKNPDITEEFFEKYCKVLEDFFF